jgi:hypothetical protein
MSDEKNMIKISNQQWLEAGLRKGYLSKDERNQAVLNKEAIHPALVAGGIGLAAAPLWESGKWLWNKATGNRSLGEMFGGYNITREQFMQIQKNYQLMMQSMDQIAVMSPRAAKAVQEAKQEIAVKMNDMARQVGVAGGTAALRGQQINQEAAAAHQKKVEDMQRQLAMQQALGKGPGGELPKDFKVNAPPPASAPAQGGKPPAPGMPGSAPSMT